MISNIHNAIKEYAEAYRQAKKVHEQAVKHIKANYKDGSDLYNSVMQTATDTFTGALKPFKTKCEETCMKDFEGARNAIQKVVAVPVSDSVLNLIPVIKDGKMTESELQMICKDRGYMETKLLYDAMGKPFTTVENVLEDLNDLEDEVHEFMSTFKGESIETISYRNALMLNGSFIDKVDKETEDFINAYSVQDPKD